MNCAVPSMASRRLLHLTTLVAIVALAPALSISQAVAQEATAASPPATQAAQSTSGIETIEVTGTLFKRADAETPSPVTTLTPEDLAQKGIINISDAIRSVTADNSGTIPNAFTDGFGAGSSGVALRGLTVNSTLVLIDGQRTANYALADDGERGFVDLNTIPFGALDEVQVLKDGASSEYGADAIGGVVNIKLKPTFQGIEGTAEGGDTEHGGGLESHLNLLVGTGDLATDRYNVYFDLESETDNRIRVGQRGYPFNTFNLTPSGGLNEIGGQPENDSGSIYGTVAPATLTGGNILTGQQVGNSLYQPLRPCGAGTTRTVNPGSGVYCAENFALDGDDAPQEDRLGAYSRLTVKVGDDAQAYLSASYFQNRTVADGTYAQIQNDIPTNTNSIALPARLPNGALNPNDPFAALGEAALINYAFGDIPSKLIEFNHVFRSVLDIKGDAWGWDYDGAATVTHTWLDTDDLGLINTQALLSAVTNGTYNFIDPSKNSSAIRAALSPPADKVSTTDLDSLQFTATHPVYDLPGGPLNFGFGTGARYESTRDPNINPNDEYQGQGLATTNGNRYVYNAFIELDAPLLSTVELNLGGRYDHYSDFGDAFSPRAQAEWRPMDNLLFRGTFTQGFRAPSFSEAGSSASVGFTTYQPPSTFANAHGNDLYGTQYTLGYETIANKNLQPEKSNSYTFGTVFEPIPGYSITVDYYNIKKSGLIEQEDPFAALNNYYAGIPLPPGYTITADLPDPAYPHAQARPIIIGAPYVNASYLKTDGIDIELNAKIDLPEEIKLTSTLNLTDILNYKVKQPDGSSLSYLGYQSPYGLSSGAGTPQYRGSLVNSFDYGPANVTVTWNYFSGIKEIANDQTGDNSCAETNQNGDPYPYGCSTKPFQDIDLTASYQVNDQLQIYGGILNLFDRPPPFDPLDYAGTNYNPTYAQSGIIGRFFRLGMTYKFTPTEAPLPPVSPALPPPPAPAPAPAPMPEKQREFQVFFDFDKSTITEAAARVIHAAADVVKSGGIAHITVTGHTDTVGTAKYNQGLSERRAASVKATLAKDGVDGGEVTTVGVGKNGLLVPTKDGVREPQNRRAVIELQ